MRRYFYILLLVVASISSAVSVYWTGDVATKNESWSIMRDGATIGFDMEESVAGNIQSIVGPGGRLLSSYHSNYADINVNDVRLHDRTGWTAASADTQTWISIRGAAMTGSLTARASR